MTKPLVAALSAAMLLAPALPRAQALMPPNTISCDGFKKQLSGEWYAWANNPPFDLGDEVRHMSITNRDILPGGHGLAGFDLYRLLEAKCGDGAK